MTFRTLAAAAALLALAPVAAQATPEIVYVNEGDEAVDIELRGRYIIGNARGWSDTVCYTQESGDVSIGTRSGTWLVFEGADCPGTPLAVTTPWMEHDMGYFQTTYWVSVEDASCEPEGITLSGLNSDFIGAGGDYVQSDVRGASQALCWNKADGSDTSVGRFYGHWMAVVGRDCPMPAAASDTLPLGQAMTCDPTESLAVDVYLP